jgi:helicase
MGIENLSLHPKILELLKMQNIASLYPPQQQAVAKVLEGQNLVLSIPTASGKSLVAYIAILHRLLTEPGKALYVVPLIALAHEKYEELKVFEELGLKVGISTGDLDDSDPRLAKYDVIVCTSEKADSLLRHRVQWVHMVKVLVIDEIHLIHDPVRGPTLEVLIAHFKALTPQTQLIALSATIQNATELSLWLGASLIQSEWRPIPLKEGVVYDHVIEYDDGKQVSLDAGHKDVLFSLLKQSIDNNGQVLIFVNARRSTVSVAKTLSAFIKTLLSSEEIQQLQKIIDDMKQHHAEQTSVDADLISCLTSGVAFHHAGLSYFQRRLVERAFKDRIIKCIVATPTLAAGVNVPAQRVIIRDLWRYDHSFGMRPIPVLEYKQQAGRAGRPRYDTFGDAITIAKDAHQKQQILRTYIHGDVEHIYSKLGTQSSLRMHLLAAIATHFVETIEDIYKFIDRTFYAYQADVYALHGAIDETLDFLSSEGFITRDNITVSATMFGQRTSSLYIDPLSAVQLKTALECSHTQNVSEMSFLHAICSTPDVRSLYLRRNDGWVGEQVDGLKDTLLLEIPIEASDEYDWFLSDMKTALLLKDWIEEQSEERLITRFDIGPGDIHSIVNTAEWLLYAAREFARMYNFSLVPYLTDLGMRVRYGCKKEVLNLISLKGIGRMRARQLFKAGYKTMGDLRKVPIERLAEVKTIGPRIAMRIKNQLDETTVDTDVPLEKYDGDVFQ